MPFACINRTFKILQFTNKLVADKTSDPMERTKIGEKHHRDQTDHCRTMPQEKQEKIGENYNPTRDKPGRIRSMPVSFREIRRL